MINRIALGILLATLIGSAPNPARAGETLREITIDDAAGKGVEVAGINVSARRGEGAFHVMLKSVKMNIAIDGERDATIYISSPDHRFVLFHERHASNEDRILLFDFTAGTKEPKVLAHSDAGDYIHLHYEIRGLSADGIRVEETQYAGDMKPRMRTVLISKAAGGYAIRNGEWKNE